MKKFARGVGLLVGLALFLLGLLAVMAGEPVFAVIVEALAALVLFLCFRGSLADNPASIRIIRTIGWVAFALTVIFALWAAIARDWPRMAAFLSISVAILLLCLYRAPDARAEARVRRQAKASERLAAAEQARADAAQRARRASEERAKQEEKLRQQRAVEQAAMHAHVEQQKAEEARRAAYAGQEAASWRSQPAWEQEPAYKTPQQLRDERRAAAREQGVASCPRCGSTSLSINKKGFGAGKAILLGPLAGTIGMNKLVITCLNCGYKFKPGKGRL